MSIKTQAIVAVSAGFLAMLVFGSIYTFGALTPYISSYLYYHDDATTNMALSILFTLTLFLINVGTFISTMLLNNVSNRLLSILAVVAMSSAVFISSFMTKFIGYVIFYGLFYGLCIGIGYFPPVRNAYLHLPNKKGLCSGIILSGFGLGSALFNLIILELINPKNVMVDIETGQYPQQIANNVPFALRILAATYLGLGLLGSVFIKPPKNIENQDQKLLTENQQSTEILKAQAQLKKSVQKQTNRELLTYFIQRKAYIVTIQVACIAPFGMFMAFNYKRMAFERNDYFKENDHLVTIIGTVGILCNGIFRLGWGYLFDHVSYKKIVITINLCLLTLCSLVLLAVQNPVTYFLIIPCIYLVYGGLYAITPTQSVRMLGQFAGAKLFWIIFSGFTFAAFIQFFIQYVLLSAFGRDGYYYCIGLFGLLQIIGLIVSIASKFENVSEENHLLPKNTITKQDSIIQ